MYRQLVRFEKIQGSKYVQSDINNTYTQVKTYLKNGKWVLFTGTPCQIAALKSYLKKDYSRLLTADLICHGVPNADFFKGYIRHLEDKLRGKVIDFKFRDKSKGWGLRGKVVYKKHGNVFVKRYFLLIHTIIITFQGDIHIVKAVMNVNMHVELGQEISPLVIIGVLRSSTLKQKEGEEFLSYWSIVRKEQC